MAPTRDCTPSVHQETFVSEMRARREAAKLSRNKLAAALGCTPQWLAKVEAYEKPPSEGLADDLDTYFQAGGMFRRTWERHVVARKRGLIPSGFRPLAEAEPDATHISIYEPLLVTGLLQTEEYARFVLGAGMRADKVDELVAIRMERQAILQRLEPPWLFVLIREAVIRDIRSEFRVEQCKRLLDVMEHPKLAIQIIPADAAVFQPCGFQVLGFKQAPDVAYVDGVGRHGQILTEPSDVQELGILFDVIRTAALSAAESQCMVRTIMENT
ncbi:helix-turn-helix domain-containing protein [Actinomadura violacea]|uniref:Helix-turn-helix transcriptional regulator n=1 Tax=Actinomadura violacea TaxID=2819934 RepID=A0ABS3RPS7_9ACTN|nr:helix-turn-helix transcriptional regulator [Actinomadura violacea]MBO2458553.1 helix-turn-helix transcriptional regulator [Actinomadura violacea]